jgi:hypothetical protein
MKKKIKDTILSKKPKTLAISPVFAIVSSDSFSRDLARIIPRMEKGIAKEVKNRLSVPSQKEREISTPVTPEIRLRIPLSFESPLILSPPVKYFNKYRLFLQFLPGD